MTISAETAQLILDVIAWANDAWCAASDDEWSDSLKVAVARNDFVSFCKDRGIGFVKG